MSATNHTLSRSLSPGAPNRTTALWVISALVVLAVTLPLVWFAYAALGLACIAALTHVAVGTICGQVDNALVGWVMIFPLGYYFLSFPREQPLITLDRVFIGVLLVAACMAGSSRAFHIPAILRRAGIWWAFFLLFAAITIPGVKNPLNSLRLLVEGFLFPALAAWYVLRHFDARGRLAALHLATCLMSISVAALAAAEVVLQQDLLPLPGGSLDTAGAGRKAEILIRPNGPFSSDNSLALVGMVALFFLMFLRQALGPEMRKWQRWLHHAGIAAAALAALMPLFRSLLIILALIALVDGIYYCRGLRRTMRLAIVGGFVLALLLVRAALPAVFEDRSDTHSFYNRIAQHGQTVALFLDHPINGAGFNNFQEAVQTSDKYSIYYQDVESVDSPHNNLGAILAESGLAGFVPFVVSQILLFIAFWRVHTKRTQDSALVWRFAAYILLAYWALGMSQTSAYVIDANLWLMLVLAVLYKYAITQRTPEKPSLVPAV